MERQKKVSSKFWHKSNMGHEKVLSLTSLERYKSLRDEYCKLQSNYHELYWIRFCNSKNKKSKWPIFDCSSFATWFYSTLFDILYDWQCINETLMYLVSTLDFNWNQEKKHYLRAWIIRMCFTVLTMPHWSSSEQLPVLLKDKRMQH